MWRALLIAILLAGCVQLPPTAEDLQAKKFEAAPDKAVIYLVRVYPDFSDLQAQVNLGDRLSLKTYPGTYYRWEVPAGAHRIAGAAFDTGAITVNAGVGAIYYVLQRVLAIRNNPSSFFEVVGEQAGRVAVQRAVLLSPEP